LDNTRLLLALVARLVLSTLLVLTGTCPFLALLFRLAVGAAAKLLPEGILAVLVEAVPLPPLGLVPLGEVLLGKVLLVATLR
jgi:hypothetical protein